MFNLFEETPLDYHVYLRSLVADVGYKITWGTKVLDVKAIRIAKNKVHLTVVDPETKRYLIPFAEKWHTPSAGGPVPLVDKEVRSMTFSLAGQNYELNGAEVIEAQSDHRTGYTIVKFNYDKHYIDSEEQS